MSELEGIAGRLRGVASAGGVSASELADRMGRLGAALAGPGTRRQGFCTGRHKRTVQTFEGGEAE